MSLLTDTDITAMINSTSNWTDKDKTLHIYPFEPESLTPMGYDLRVGHRYVSALHGGPFDLKTGESIKIDSGDTVLIETLETVDLPQNKTISALVASKVTIVSQGFSHISTTIDSDWYGSLLISITNHAREPLKLDYGTAFCTVIFFQNKSPSTKPGGKPPNRTDVLFRIIAEQAKKKIILERKQKVRERFLILVPVFIIILSIICGYLLFRTGNGFVAVVAAGIALAEAVFLTLRSKYG